MSVNSVDSNNSNIGLITAGSAIAGGSAGALAGYYSKPWLKDGAPTDTFVKKVGEKLLNATDDNISKEQKEVFKNAQSMIDKIKNAKTVEEYRNANLEPVYKLFDSMDIDTLKADWGNACNFLDNFNFEKTDISKFNDKFANATSVEEYKRILAEAVDAEINTKGLDKCKQEFLNTIDTMRKNGIPVTMDDVTKMLFKEVYDKDAKKLVKGEDITDKAFNIFKNAAKKMQGKSAAIWGAVGAAALGIGGYITASAFGRKQPDKQKENDTQA